MTSFTASDVSVSVKINGEDVKVDSYEHGAANMQQVIAQLLVIKRISADNLRLSKQRAELLEALKKCLEKGSRWHVCDPVVIQSKQAIANAEK